MNGIIEREGTYSGFRWIVVAYYSGHRCGYVVIPKGHELYGLDYNHGALYDISCHGGLTYSGINQWVDGEWTIGFDCAHASDKKDVSIMSDSYKESYRRLEAAGLIDDVDFMGYPVTIKDADFVQGECEKIIDQIINKSV